MSNHIAKSVNWLPEISSSATSTIVGVVISFPFSRRITSIAPSRRPASGHHDPERVEEDERVEVADHVLLAQPPEEALHEQPRDPRHDAAQLDPRLLADAVDRPRGEVAHARVPDVQVHEHVVREAVAGVDAVEVELGEHRPRDRRVAGLRVGDVPVAGGDLRQQREDRVAEVARARDQLPGLTGDEAVRLRVVDLAARDRLDEREQVGRIHLVVGRHHADDVEPVLERALVAGDDRGADAAVPLARDELDARVGRRAHGLGGAVGGGVVDDEDPVDELRDPGERRPDQPLLVVGGDDDRDALAVDHALGGAGAAREERVGEERRDRSRAGARSARRSGRRCGRCAPSS